MHRLIFAVLMLAGLAFAAISPASPVSAASAATCKIPRGGDTVGNEIGDVGVQVVCNYTSVYAEDASGAYYWDLGDGRIDSSAGIDSIDDLNQETLSVCDYQIHTKGSFENDPFQDTGVISNMIRCSGYDGTSTFNYQIVHETDPRYTGNANWAIWDTWEYYVLTESRSGNNVRVPLTGNVAP